MICLYRPWSKRTSSGFPFFFRTWTECRSAAILTYVQHSRKEVGNVLPFCEEASKSSDSGWSHQHIGCMGITVNLCKCNIVSSQPSGAFENVMGVCAWAFGYRLNRRKLGSQGACAELYSCKRTNLHGLPGCKAANRLNAVHACMYAAAEGSTHIPKREDHLIESLRDQLCHVAGLDTHALQRLPVAHRCSSHKLHGDDALRGQVVQYLGYLRVETAPSFLSIKSSSPMEAVWSLQVSWLERSIPNDDGQTHMEAAPGSAFSLHSDVEWQA